jgi:hypothetical protein
VLYAWADKRPKVLPAVNPCMEFLTPSNDVFVGEFGKDMSWEKWWFSGGRNYIGKLSHEAGFLSDPSTCINGFSINEPPQYFPKLGEIKGDTRMTHHNARRISNDQFRKRLEKMPGPVGDNCVVDWSKKLFLWRLSAWSCRTRNYICTTARLCRNHQARIML